MPSRPIFPLKQVMLLSVAFIIFFVVVVFNGCKKLVIYSHPDDPKLVEAFFKLPDSASNEEKLLVDDLKSQFAPNNGVSNFLSWHGQPLWANAFIARQDSKNFTFIVPTKKESYDFIQTFFLAYCTNGKFKYEMHRQSSLVNNRFEASKRGITANQSDLFFAYFNKSVLSYNKYDKRTHLPVYSSGNAQVVNSKATADSNIIEGVNLSSDNAGCTKICLIIGPLEKNVSAGSSFAPCTTCDCFFVCPNPGDGNGDGGGGTGGDGTGGDGGGKGGGGGGSPTGGGGAGGGSGGGGSPTGGGGGTGGGGTPTDSLPNACPTQSLIHVWYSQYPTGRVDPCGNPIPAPDTVPSILTILHNENVDIKSKRDSIWNLAYTHNEEWHFFIVIQNGHSVITGDTTDHSENSVEPERKASHGFYGPPVGDWHSHQDATSGERHPTDPTDISHSNGHYLQLNYRAYVDCGDTLYAVVTENVSLAKAFFRAHNLVAMMDEAPWTNLQTAGQQRRKLGLQYLKELLGDGSVSGMGLYKTTDADKTNFIRIN